MGEVEHILDVLSFDRVRPEDLERIPVLRTLLDALGTESCRYVCTESVGLGLTLLRHANGSLYLVEGQFRLLTFRTFVEAGYREVALPKT